MGITEDKERIALKIIQISDLHITPHRDLLTPMIEAINRENVDLVVVTGDIVQFETKGLYEKASEALNQIKHRVVAIPGDYDGSELWEEYFGNNRRNAMNLNGFGIVLMDTSFMRHRFAVGWGDVLEEEDKEQHNWLMEQLNSEKYQIVFSHHPFWVNPTKAGDKYVTDTLRSVYSGHIHDPIKFYYKYENPKSSFAHGFSCVPMKFHGNSCYLIILVKSNGEMVNIPRVVGAKRTAW